MKAITNLVKGMMIVMVSLLIFSCSDGEDGAIGPAGQDGVNGVDGTNGTDGSNGADGVDGEGGPPGTANVIYSDWIATDLKLMYRLKLMNNFSPLLILANSI